MKRIVVVDDNPEYLDLLTQDLEDEKEEIIPLLDQGYEDTCQKVIEQKPDILFVDVYLASMPIEQFCESIRSNPGYVDLPIYLVSCVDESEIKETAANLRVDGWLPKPVPVDQFRAILQKHFDSDSSE